MTRPVQQRGDATKEALLKAAIAVFGRDGFQAASTRAIAQAAGVNQALIKYHFAHKQGLYEAAVGHIADRVGQRVRPILEEIAATGAEGDPVAGRRGLERLLGTVAGLVSQDEAADWAQLLVREQQAPGPAFETVYSRIMGPALETMARLVGTIDPAQRRGNPKMVAIGLVGQILVVRVAHAAMMRFVGWERIGEAEIAEIRNQLHLTLDRLFPETERKS